VRHLAVSSFKPPDWGYSHAVRDHACALAAADHAAIHDNVMLAAAYLHDIHGFAPWVKPKAIIRMSTPMR